MKLSPQAINILKRVRENILKKPESYCHDRVSNDCGTTFCVAGHINVLTGADYSTVTGYKNSAEAAEALGISPSDAEPLFFYPFKISGISHEDVYVAWGNSSSTPPERAAIGAKIITKFIEQHS